ncbi:TolC family protein [Cupriavidus sp. UYPR2.512]|uniref:TolC family protein n=1 Tax=Cupriavidus sp. UYPR2.512 TaxID=1080187 RepID=UPI000375A938|nr:TolC family protein [Cupriavidus sp. UYPR2.512]UIF87960.1 TolC family protein [Cupriavidus necator]
MTRKLYVTLAATVSTMTIWSAAAQASGAHGYLPDEAVVREAIAGSPDVMAAEARRDATLARAVGIRAGTAETVVRAVGQGRSVREPTQRFPEGQIAVDRPLRLWGKADADARLAHATAEAGDLAVMDARHESSRQVLALCFAVMRAGQARLAAQDNVRAAGELVAITTRRIQAGDAARLDGELAASDHARTQAALATAAAAEQAALAELRGRFPGLGEPRPLAGAALPPVPHEPPEALRTDYVRGSHEYRLAMAQEAQALQQAARADLERKPDPTVGMFVMIERGGAERILGVSVAMPLGGDHRLAAATAAAADADAAARSRMAAERRLGTEFDVQYRNLVGRRSSAQAQAEAASLQRTASDRATRAYRAGESGLAELLAVRRSLAEVLLAERLARVDALEADSRLGLDLHRMWDFDD